jgi:hypothetical protein
MFERYTEKARRVIFFARYEPSQYGSSYIDTEHLLLGLLREAPEIVKFLGPNSVMADIRDEIDRQVARGDRISTSVEMPLSAESKKILNLAGEEAQRLAHRWIGTEHLLLGMLRVDSSLAARLLRDRGVKAEIVREELAKAPPTGSFGGAMAGSRVLNLPAVPRPRKPAIATVDSFLAGLKLHSWEKLPTTFFAQKAQFVDSNGRRWQGLEEIERQFEALFAPYAKKNVTFILEGTSAGLGDSFIASILWDNVMIGGEPPHRMTVILAPEGEDWAIFFLQVTPVLIR